MMRIKAYGNSVVIVVARSKQRAQSIRTNLLVSKFARGCYQRALLRGEESWAGSGLRGNARKYSAHYARSRANLLARIQREYFADTAIDPVDRRRKIVIFADHEIRENVRTMFGFIPDPDRALGHCCDHGVSLQAHCYSCEAHHAKRA